MTDQPKRGKRVNIYLPADLLERWEATPRYERSAIVAEALRVFWKGKDATMSDELMDLINGATPTDADLAAQIRHQNERDEATIAVLEEQLRTGKYDVVGRYPTTRQDVVEAIAGYRAMIARRGQGK